MREALATSVLALGEVIDERSRGPVLPSSSRRALKTRLTHGDVGRVSQGRLWDLTTLRLP